MQGHRPLHSHVSDLKSAFEKARPGKRKCPRGPPGFPAAETGRGAVALPAPMSRLQAPAFLVELDEQGPDGGEHFFAARTGARMKTQGHALAVA